MENFDERLKMEKITKNILRIIGVIGIILALIGISLLLYKIIKGF